MSQRLFSNSFLFPMRAIAIFILFVALAYICGAIIAYPLQLVFDPYLQLEYRKYINYATLLGGLLISGIYLKTCSTLSLKALGFSGSIATYIKQLLIACGYGILVMLCIELVLLLLDIREFNPRRNYTLDVFAIRLLKAVLAGLFIGLLEEAIFRGGMLSGLYKQTNAIISVSLSSLLYSAAHFIRYRDVPDGMEVGWLTGVMMLPDAFWRFYQWSILDYFLALFMFGVVLSLLRLRHGTIAPCIGWHAGAVIMIKLADYYSQRTNVSQFEYLVNQYNVNFGWISFGVMSGLAVIYIYRLHKAASKD